MNVIDTIIEQRSKIMEIATSHGVTSLKLFGSVLARAEHSNSDIDFLVTFDPSKYVEDDTELTGKRYEALVDLEIAFGTLFDRPVQVLDSEHIPTFFRSVIENDPVDIMQLEAGKHYPTTPKTSKQYFIMLNKLFKEYESIDIEKSEYANALYTSQAEQISFQFSKLLKLGDNDLRTYEGFYFVEVLYICEHLFYSLDEHDPEDINRFKELLPLIKQYVDTRLPTYL